jgi:hypothetical protein
MAKKKSSGTVTLTPERVTARARKDPAFLKRALKIPGLRSKLADDLLPASMQQTRGLNARLNNPIVAGSSITGRDLAHQATAATRVQYGPQEAQLTANLKDERQRLGDIGGWYNQYQAQVAQNAQQVAAAQDAATQQISALGQGVAGLGAQTLQSVAGAQQAQQVPGQPAAPVAPDAAATANQSTTARQMMVANLAAQAAQQGASAKTYASGVAGVVAPQERLGALINQQRNIRDVSDQQTALKAQEGAYSQKYRADTTQQEFANQLSRQTLKLNTTKAAADAAASSPQAQTAKAGLEVDQANAKTAGMTLKGYQSLSPAAQIKAVEDARKRAKTPVAKKDQTILTGPFTGLNPQAVAAMSPAQRDKRIKTYYSLTHADPRDKAAKELSSDAKFKKLYGVAPNSANQHREFRDDVAKVQSFISQNSLQGSRHDLANTLKAGGYILKDPSKPDKPANRLTIPKFGETAISVALDLNNLHGISRGTANRLHHSGYKNSVLGYPMAPSSGSSDTYVKPKRKATTGSRGDAQ